MSNEEFEIATEGLIEQFLVFLRGLGPEPDTSSLPTAARQLLPEQFELLAALADRHPELPPVELDPVALRLGLFGSQNESRLSEGVVPADAIAEFVDDPLKLTLEELVLRFDRQVVVDLHPAWAGEPLSDLVPIAECTTLGAAVAVFVTDVDLWASEPDSVAAFFRRHTNVTAVGLVTGDAERAVVLTVADSNRSIDPVRGWLSPHNPRPPEHLSIALGRYFEGFVPRWDRAANMEELLELGDITADAAEVTAAQLAEALRVKPRLQYKKEAARVLENLDPTLLSAVIVDVQSGRVAGPDLIDRLNALAEAARP